MALKLKKGAFNVKMISGIAFKNDVDELEGADKMVYQAAINVLLNTLKSGNE